MGKRIMLEEKEDHVLLNGELYSKHDKYCIIINDYHIVLGLVLDKDIFNGIEILNNFVHNTNTGFILQEHVEITVLKTRIKTKCLGYDFTFEWEFVPVGCVMENIIMVGQFASPIFLSRVLTIGKVYEALGK